MYEFQVQASRDSEFFQVLGILPWEGALTGLLEVRGHMEQRLVLTAKDNRTGSICESGRNQKSQIPSPKLQCQHYELKKLIYFKPLNFGVFSYTP
jgi:hypothetical protein